MLLEHEVCVAAPLRRGDLTGDFFLVLFDPVAQSVEEGHLIGCEDSHLPVFQVSNSLGDSDTVPLKIVVTSPDNELELELSEYIVYLKQGERYDPDAYITTPAAWAVDVEHKVDTSVPGTYYVCYTYENDTVYQTVIVK